MSHFPPRLGSWAPPPFPQTRLPTSVPPAFLLNQRKPVIMPCLISHTDPPLSQTPTPLSLLPCFSLLPSFLLLTLLCISDILYHFHIFIMFIAYKLCPLPRMSSLGGQEFWSSPSPTYKSQAPSTVTGTRWALNTHGKERQSCWWRGWGWGDGDCKSSRSSSFSSLPSLF